MRWWKQLLLNTYYPATVPYRRWQARRDALAGAAPIAVLFYHRVADTFPNAWTCPTRTFSNQMHWLQDRFDMISLAEAQQRIRSEHNSRPAVSITFDDAYSENCDHALPLLVKEQIPCTYFVTTRNALHGIPFPHDVAMGRPTRPNTPDELRWMAEAGIELGAHTRTHADLGRISDPRVLHDEVIAARDELEAVIDRPIRYFAFPFGLPHNLNPAVFAMARAAGYHGVCSAYGGYNFPGDDPFHIQRVHGDPEMIRVKNSVTIDPRKRRTPRFRYACEHVDEQANLELLGV